MKIVEGGFPQEKEWRALVLLGLQQQVGRAWHLGMALARAHKGDLVTAVVIPNGLAETIAAARQTLQQARALADEKDNHYTLIIQAVNSEKGIRELAEESDADILLIHREGRSLYNIDQTPCGIAVLRESEVASEVDNFQRILVPTHGGPNSIYALRSLLPLTKQMSVTALYVSPSYLGANEEALGQARLHQTINFLDAQEQIESKLLTAEAVLDGIINEAANYDLVVIGASLESSLDKVLFGNLPQALIQQSRKPVMIVRQPKRRWQNLGSLLAWQVQHIIPRKTIPERQDAYVRIRRSTRPTRDFYILIALSAMIAALGLIINSPAVVIGAMLVAPLMSPIVGTGMAIVLGDARFLRLALGAVGRGAGLAIGVGVLAGLLHINQPLTSELLARTQPTLIDLGIALFSGMAGAYALSHSAAAGALPGVAIAAALVPPLATVGIAFILGVAAFPSDPKLAAAHLQDSLGALLLFTTNFVAISSATALIFLILGFRPTQGQRSRRVVQARTTRVALLLLMVIALLLGVTTYQLAEESRTQSRIYEVTETQLSEVTGATLVSLTPTFEDGRLQLDITARSPSVIPYFRVQELQEAIGAQLLADEIALRDVGLTLTVIEVTTLDPLVPPTATSTPTVTNTPTPGPTPTATNTPVPTNTPTLIPSQTPTTQPSATVMPTDTATPVPTATATTIPTETPTSVPTALINAAYGLNMRSSPSVDAPVLAFLQAETAVILRTGIETADDIVWQEIEVNGVVGWVSDEFLTR